AERGLHPLVLERATVAAGATGRSSGMVRMHYDVEADARLAWRSHAYFRDWEHRVGGESGFSNVGFLQMVPPEEVPALRANTAMQQRIGIVTSVVDADEVRRLLPGIAIEDDQVAAFEPLSGYADPTQTTASLMAGALARGARLMQGCGVTGVRVAGGRVGGVDTSRGPFDAPIVVDAAGAWAGRVAAMVGLDIPVNVWRHDVAYVQRPADIPRHVGFIDFLNAFYSRPEGESLTLVALEDGNPLQGDPDAPVDAAAVGFIERAAERVVRRLPQFARAGIHSAHSGQDGITPDQHPIIGPAGPDGFWLDCGFSGTGFKIAPAVGASLAQLIVDGPTANPDLALYRLERFAEGKPIVGEHPYGPIWY
ncbi:MAG TPA: FAD-binding oxidoreductase, partial [Candidatus Limnocylindria bacterium]|nr:FAD-binding oxidoreductase [Candidatus Limnocylindria bacterium]